MSSPEPRPVPPRPAARARRPLPPRKSRPEPEPEPEPRAGAQPDPHWPAADGGPKHEADPEPDPQQPQQPQQQVPWLALGDSYTIGHGVSAAERWPVQLAAQLALPEPTLVARTGWTAADLQAALDAASLGPGQFALVSVMVGANDQIRGSGNLGNARPATEPFRAAIVSLLERAVSLSVGGDPRRVVVLSLPDWTCTPAGLKRSIAVNDSGLSATVVERQIDSYNSVLREGAEAILRKELAGKSRRKGR